MIDSLISDEIRDIANEMKPVFIVADELRVQKVLQATKDLTVKVITIGSTSSSDVSFDQLLSDENSKGKRKHSFQLL